MNFLQQLTGSFAQPAAENPTVEMIEAAYRHHRLPWRYINCEVAPEHLGDAVRGARAMGFAGFNCSLPHKVAVIEHLDGLGESAAIMGAVNCVVRRDGQYIGENTDGKGFLKSLRERIDPSGKRLVILGAGGAARAIAVETGLAGAAGITIVNRNRSRGEDIERNCCKNRRRPKRNSSLGIARFPSRTTADVLVNATSVGLYPDVDRPFGYRGGHAAPVIGRRRRHSQSLENAVDPGRRIARLYRNRRSGHAGQSGRDQHQVLDGSRGGSARDAGSRDRGAGDQVNSDYTDSRGSRQFRTNQGQRPPSATTGAEENEGSHDGHEDIRTHRVAAARRLMGCTPGPRINDLTASRQRRLREREARSACRC